MKTILKTIWNKEPYIFVFPAIYCLVIVIALVMGIHYGLFNSATSVFAFIVAVIICSLLFVVAPLASVYFSKE